MSTLVWPLTCVDGCWWPWQESTCNLLLGRRLRLVGDLLAAPHRVGQGWGVRSLHLEVLDRLGEQGRLDGPRADVDT